MGKTPCEHPIGRLLAYSLIVLGILFLITMVVACYAACIIPGKEGFTFISLFSGLFGAFTLVGGLCCGEEYDVI